MYSCNEPLSNSHIQAELEDFFLPIKIDSITYQFSISISKLKFLFYYVPYYINT